MIKNRFPENQGCRNWTYFKANTEGARQNSLKSNGFFTTQWQIIPSSFPQSSSRMFLSHWENKEQEEKSPSPSSVLKKGNIRHHGMSQGQSFRSGDFIVVISWHATNFQGHRVKPVKMGIKIQPRCPTVTGIFHQINWWPKAFYHKLIFVFPPAAWRKMARDRHLPTRKMQ